MEEGIFVGWLKKDGEMISNGEALFTLESEKSAQDIESTDSGTLHIPAYSPHPGATVKVGQVIGYLLGKDEAVDSVRTSGNQPSGQQENDGEISSDLGLPVSPTNPIPAKTQIAETGKIPASSPRARRQAARLGVDLARVQGSGNKGRITETDVLKAATSQNNSASRDGESKKAAVVTSNVSTMRRNIAERTSLSFSQIPHFYLHAEVDATELIRTREHLVAFLEKESGVRITLTDFLLRAQVAALRGFPAANAVWQNDGIVTYSNIDVGVVVGLPEGLVIPVIRAAQKLSFVELARERARLVETVRQGKFDAEMVSGGATSISNLGTTRTDEFAAIIAPHQSSMLAVGRAAPRPYVVKDRLEIRTTIRLCLSMDHRVLDGGPAAEFLGKIVERLENPKLLVEAGE